MPSVNSSFPLQSFQHTLSFGYKYNIPAVDDTAMFQLKA
jgi:hypothetical protein